MEVLEMKSNDDAFVFLSLYVWEVMPHAISDPCMKIVYDDIL